VRLEEGREERESAHPAVFQALFGSCDSALNGLLGHVGNIYEGKVGRMSVL